jgi:N-succinyldiaminopimelate aminotransferase
MNPDLKKLHSYPFARLRELLAGEPSNPQYTAISLAVGEPKYPPPALAIDALNNSLHRINAYPSAKGESALREAIAGWLSRRYGLGQSIDPESMVLPVLGTREALFAVAQALVDRTKNNVPLVVMPSPFYQIYEGAAIMAGAEPHYLPCSSSNHFVPNLNQVTPDIWQRCQMVYVCSPSNPTGAVLNADFYRQLLALADQYDFVIVSDECYSEIYNDELKPCTGLLEVCGQLGRNDYSRCLIFNSLSKRSNLAGMRSGFVAGSANLIDAFLLYRTYHGSAMPFHHQAASIAAWNDDAHVIENRARYQQCLQAVVPVLQQSLELSMPQGGFCLWAKTPINDEQFARELFIQQGVTVVPGQYLARSVDGINAGENYIRIALVEPVEQCLEAARRINAFVATLG